MLCKIPGSSHTHMWHPKVRVTCCDVDEWAIYLCVLLLIRHSCIVRLHVPAIIAIHRFPSEMNATLNSSRPRLIAILKRAAKKLVAKASDRRNTVWLKLDVDVFVCCMQFDYIAFPCVLDALMCPVMMEEEMWSMLIAVITL